MNGTGFEKFGKISYTSEGKAKAFVDYLEKGKLMGTQCSGCKRVYFPPRMDCGKCHASDSTAWVEIPNKWTLLTHTTAHFAPQGFEQDTPYVIGVAESNGGQRLLARVVVGTEGGEITDAMKLELRVAKLPGGRVVYEFRPAGGPPL